MIRKMCPLLFPLFESSFLPDVLEDVLGRERRNGYYVLQASYKFNILSFSDSQLPEDIKSKLLSVHIKFVRSCIDACDLVLVFASPDQIPNGMQQFIDYASDCKKDIRYYSNILIV